MKENIIINYLLLEQILKITGTYNTICDDYEFLLEIFNQAKIGDIKSLFQNNDVKDMALEIIENLTGVSKKYWTGEERIKLGIRCTNKAVLNKNGYPIDKIELNNIQYKDLMENPLNINMEELYANRLGLNLVEINKNVVEYDKKVEEMDNVKNLYNLKGLITVLLINIKDTSGIRLLDKRDVYKHSEWEPYMGKFKKPTEHDITYCPKYIEIRRGLVQTIIKNILLTGYVPFTIKDL